MIASIPCTEGRPGILKTAVSATHVRMKSKSEVTHLLRNSVSSCSVNVGAIVKVVKKDVAGEVVSHFRSRVVPGRISHAIAERLRDLAAGGSQKYSSLPSL
jgi:hypothetical protein